MLSYKRRENKTCVKPRSCKLQPLPVDLKTSTNAREDTSPAGVEPVRFQMKTIHSKLELTESREGPYFLAPSRFSFTFFEYGD